MFKLPSNFAHLPLASRGQTAAFMLAVALMAAPITTTPAHAQNKQIPATITVSGQGKISLAPDMGVVTTRVVTPAKTAPEALSMNTEAMNKVIADIKAAGIEERDIQTSGFAIFPRYADRRNKPDQPIEIIGYQVSNGVTVNIRDLSKLGTVLDTVVRSGANEVNGINFQVSNADKMLDTARKAAVSNAKAKAELYAEAAGVQLGRVLSISEAGAAAPRPYAMRAEKMMMDSAPVPIQAGEEILSSSVTIVWELTQ